MFNIEHHERIPFKRHFIKNVILELRFSDLITDLSTSNVEYLKSSFQKLDFNKNTTIKHVEFSMKIDDNEPKKAYNEEDAGLIFINEQDKSQLEITQNRMVYSESQYKSFDDFETRIIKIIGVINSLNKNIEIIYIGFRKINSIIITETKSFEDITKYFNNTIFAPLRTNLLELEKFENYKDRIEVAFENNRAIINTSVSKKTNEIFEVILDMDIINTTPNKRTKLTDELERVNNLVYDLFIYIGTDELKEEMNKGS